VLGVGETADYRVVLANLGGAWRIGVQTDVLSRDLVAVFIPNSPNTLSGGCSSSPPTACVPASAAPPRWGLSGAAEHERGRYWANSQWSGQPSRTFDEVDSFSIGRPNR
jgi:hypothetical protein